MNTSGFDLNEHCKGPDFVCFKACFADLQRANINTK